MTGSAPPEDSEAREPSLLSRLRIVHALPLVPVFLIALLASSEIRDNSFVWHIRAGAVQLSTGSVLTEDVFSFTEQGTQWRTQSWLVELLYGTVDGLMPSLAWVNWMVFIVAVATIAFVGLSMYRSVASPVTVGFSLIVGIWLLGPFFQPRPVIFSFLLLAALVVVLQNRERMLWLVVPLIWLWAGAHGSWIFGGLLVILEWLRTGDRRIVRVGLVSLGATLATAHGLGTWQIVVDFLGSRDALALMEEWHVPDFGGILQMPYLLLIAGVMVAGIQGRLKMRDLFVVLPFLFIGMTSRRAVVPAAIILMPWAILALPTIRVPRSSARPSVAIAAVTVVGVLALTPMMRESVGTLDYARFPSDEALSYLAGTTAYHDDVVGGYLIYREWPERLVWIDDRAELHSVERLMEHGQTIAGNYRPVFERYGFDAVLSRHTWDLTERLIEDGWYPVYEDDEFVVLLP